MQISIVLSKGVLVKSEFRSKLPTDTVGSCSHTYSVCCNESLTVYSRFKGGFNMGTKKLSRLHVGVCKADKISRKMEQSSNSCLCTLQIRITKDGLSHTQNDMLLYLIQL